jgi:DNA-binding MarR family transcriptional regulator
MAEPGWRVVLLLAATFSAGVEDAHAEVAAGGHPEARPLHGFALQAIGVNGCTIAELGQRLGVTKQAAAKTAATLERLEYVERSEVPGDRRSVLLTRTRRAEEMLAASEVAFERTVAEWRHRLGDVRYDAMVEALVELTGDAPTVHLPGLLAPRSGSPTTT